MAGEINFRHTDTGDTIYAVVTTAATGTYWNGAAFEVCVVANWGNYDIALTETPVASYHYQGTFPGGIAVGNYSILIFEQVGGAPAISDTLLGTLDMAWDGAAEEAPSTHTAADVVTAWLAKAGWTAGGAATLEDAMKALFSLARGKIVKTGDSYEFLDDDDATTLHTLTIAAGSRTTA